MLTIEDLINNTIPESARCILKESGIELREAPKAELKWDLAATIGFSGEDGNGALGFFAERSILKAEYGEDSKVLSDGWLGEIANQLLGRLKNSLLAYGLEIHLQIPEVVDQIEDAYFPKTEKSRVFPYATNFGCCCIWIEADWDFGRVLETAAAEEHAQAEGEMILF